MTERFEIDFAPGAREERVLAQRSGGRLRMEVEGFTSGKHMVPYELIGPSGNQVSGPTVVADEGDGGGGFMGSEGWLSLKLPSAMEPCLEPGTYEVRVQGDEYDVAPVRVEVRALETVTARLKARWR
ncbi:MAG TPA: hypothetical protein VK843_06630 [Planctomycetota bacterium]|nr:hypothetical protein [Planctomycetota bacterium]